MNVMKIHALETLFQKVLKKGSAANIDKGFTLLEIVVAIAILGIIISSLYPAYTGTYRNIEIAENESNIYYMARIAMARMADDLESAYIPETSIDSDLNNLNSFTGENEYVDGSRVDQIRFFSRARVNFGEYQETVEGAGIAYYTARDEDNGTMTLYRADTAESLDRYEEEREGFIVCEGLKSFYLTYRDKNSQEYDTWDSTDTNFMNRLPSVVVITLEFANKINSERTVKFSTGVFLPMADKNG